MKSFLKLNDENLCILTALCGIQQTGWNRAPHHLTRIQLKRQSSRITAPVNVTDWNISDCYSTCADAVIAWMEDVFDKNGLVSNGTAPLDGCRILSEFPRQDGEEVLPACLLCFALLRLTATSFSHRCGLKKKKRKPCRVEHLIKVWASRRLREYDCRRCLLASQAARAGCKAGGGGGLNTEPLFSPAKCRSLHIPAIAIRKTGLSSLSQTSAVGW